MYLVEADRQALVDGTFVSHNALREAAVIRYGRCFASGVRESLSHALLQSAPTDLQSAHLHFIDLRNKHVAHSVNEFEETDVVILMEKVGHWYEIWDVGTMHVRRHLADTVELDLLLRLTNWLISEVERLSELERDKLFRIAIAMGRRAVNKLGVVETGTVAFAARNPRQRRRGP